MFFRQIRDHGDNFSYVIADEASCEAAVVDSSFNVVEILRLLKSEGYLLKFIFCTHGHFDHTAGNQQLKSVAGGKIVAYQLSQTQADIFLEDEAVLFLGCVPIRVIYTPGHSLDSICLLVNEKKLLTGDTLFVGECGRTDLPGGDAKRLHSSLFNRLSKLEDEVEVYPGHDYGATPFSTLGIERRSNYVLVPRSVEEFVKFMGQL